MFRSRLSVICLLTASSASAVDSIWVGGLSGDWTVAGNWSAGIPQAAGDTATINTSAAITVPSSITLKTLTVTAPATITVASGATLAFSNSGGDVLIASAALTIDGEGSLTFSRNGTSTTDFANLKPAAGVTVTLDARIIDASGAGIELNAAGTVLLTHPDNSFTGIAIVSAANGTIAFSHPGALGLAAMRFHGSPSRFVYTGSSSATLTLPVQITAGNATFENAGGDTLTLGGLISPVSSGNKTLTFSGAGRTTAVSGSLANGAGVLNVVSGSGTLLLSGAATNSSLTVNNAATLAVDAGALFQNVSLTNNAGSALVLNPSLGDGYTALLPNSTVLNGAGVRIVLPAAATASTVTLPNLIRANTLSSLDIEAVSLGTPANTLFIQNFTPGPLPSWITVNGLPASYDATLGVLPVTASGDTISLTALGPSVIPDAPTSAAVIDSAGTAGGITLAADPTTIFSLTQDHAANPTAVDFGGQTLAATLVAISAAGNNLTLSNGTLSAPGAIELPAGSDTLPALATEPIAWYDLADSSTVTTNAAGRITLLANKGSAGAALNAVVPADRAAPRYVPGAVNGRGVARSDSFSPPQGLVSLGNAGISGAAARTAFLVARRLPVSQNAFYALFLGADDAANQTFAIVERADRTSFVTMANDLEGTPSSPPTHNVLTFITGQGGVPNAGEGFRNGVSVGAKTFALATADNPICLLHRLTPSKAYSGPGEVAEAIVYNYALSASERAEVEAYLMRKWNISAPRNDALLALRNENAVSELTVSAALTEAYGTSLTLSKSGPGPVTLAGPVTFSGPLALNNGLLTFDTPAGHTALVASPVSGVGTLRKSGLGDLMLSLASPYYSGSVEILAGTLFTGINGSLGTGPVSVSNGGALDIVSGTTAIANPISVSGAGPDGLGALRHSGGVNQQNAFTTVNLTDDTTVFSASRMDVRGGAFDFGGHSLTVNGGGEFSIVLSSISNVTAATGVNVANGMMRFEQSDFQGTAANIASAASGAGVCLYQQLVPMAWSLQLADNAYFRANNGGMDTNLNRWAGPVTLTSGTARLTALAGASGTITGAIGGDGGLLKEGDGWFWLFNPANTYAGATAVTQGNLYAVSPGSLGAQAGAGLTVSGAGGFVARVASDTSPDGWSVAELEDIFDTDTFTTPGTTSLGFDTRYADLDYTAAIPHVGLKKFGAYKLTLSGSVQDLGAVEVYGGELDLTGTGGHSLGTNSVVVGAWSDTSATTLRLAGAALSTSDPGYNRAGPQLAIGSSANTRSVLHVGADAVANGRLIVGNSAGSAGAVYQTGGSVTNTGGSANDAALGVSGSGYYRLDGGIFAHKGYTQFGRLSGSAGFFEQRGGSVVINAGTAPADGVVGDYYNGTFTTRKGIGVFLLSGGTFNLNNHTLQLGEWVSAGDYNDGYGTLTLENDAQAETAQIVLANRNGNPQAYVNLNGGTLTAPYFQKGGDNTAGNTAQAAISFNGGRLRVPSAGSAFSSLVRTGANNTPALLNIYPGGAVIETLDDGKISLDLPLRAPANFGVTNVSLTAAGAGYIAPPVVTFSGGGGTGATAVAEINLASGQLTGIRVTSPGVGYTNTPSVVLRGGGFTAAATATATLGTLASGGLTKLGPGTLALNAANTYSGPTVVSNGTLRLGAGGLTLSALTPITIANGTLDLGGASFTNVNPVILENGRLINGFVTARSITKSGSGTVTLDAKTGALSPAALRNVALFAMKPLIWYDPSDTASGNVVTNAAGRVSRLLNKGTLGSSHDAIPYNGAGPLYRSGASSPSPLGAGVLHVDGDTAALTTAANVPVTGTAPRTLIALIARDTSRGTVGIGSGADGQTFEIGNDPTKTYISGIGGGRDTQFTAGIPAVDQLTFIAAVNGYNGNLVRGIQLWRSTGTALETLTATWPADLGTASAPFSIGRRGNTIYRGKVGEVLLFDRVLSAIEIAEIKDILVAKYLIAPPSDSPAVPTVTVAGGTLRLAPGPDFVTRLAPLVWYDPSDAATVTTNAAGRVLGLLNKGSKSGMDMSTNLVNGTKALVPPLLATGALTYAASRLPMIMIDSNNCGLASGANIGITGAALRTVVSVCSRFDDNTGAIVAFGTAASGALFEVGDRSSTTVVGCFGTGNDLNMTPRNPIRTPNVYFGALTGPKNTEAWRTGVAPTNVAWTTTSTLNTGASRFLIGQRPAVADRADFRGQVGEVLVFDRLLTATERAGLEEYLVSKWMSAGGANRGFEGVTFDVAAGATLDLGGINKNVTVTGSGTVTNGTLGAGFVISPAGDSAVGELDLTGTAVGTGAQYRLTTSGGGASDRLLINGDLSGLTVVPATEDTVAGGTYVIATGAITQKPALSGFPEKFKLVQSGENLLLTSLGGTLIRLK